MTITPLPIDRYRTDVHFHALVDMMEQLLQDARFTPQEIQEALHLATEAALGSRAFQLA